MHVASYHVRGKSRGYQSHSLSTTPLVTLSSAAISTPCSCSSSCSRSLLLLVESFTHTCKRHMKEIVGDQRASAPRAAECKHQPQTTQQYTIQTNTQTSGSAHLQLLLKLSVVDGSATALRAARALLALPTSSGSSSGSSPGCLCGSCHRLCVPLLSL